MERTKRWHAGLFALAVFAFAFVFFAKVHPLVLYDGDDWATASYQRGALPKWHGWNPGRVFPEIFMPLCTSIGAHVLYPLTGDYVGAMSLVFAFTAAAFITAYVGLLRRFAGRRFALDAPASVLLAALFLALHFLCFRAQEYGNEHLFYAGNVCTFFYYTLPALLNADIVLLWEAGGCFERFADPRHPARDGLLLLAVYLGVFPTCSAARSWRSTRACASRRTSARGACGQRRCAEPPRGCLRGMRGRASCCCSGWRR